MAKSGYETLARSFIAGHPAEAAHTLESLEPEAALAILSKLPPRRVGPLLERMAPATAASLLGQLGAEETRAILDAVPARQAAAIVLQLEDAAREATLAGLGTEHATRIRALLHYPPDSAGGLMDTQVSSLRSDLSVSRAIAQIRRSRRQTLYYLYVTDPDGRLVGVLNMRELLLARPNDPIEGLVHRDLVTVPASMSRSELADLVRDRRYIALPVVDSDNILLGVVRPDEILAAIEQEAFGDLQKIFGAGEDERALSPVSVVVRKRLPWLYVNLATAFIAAAVVGLFEGTIEKVTALAVLLPVVAGQGGNTGAQSLAIVMRGIALRELTPGTTSNLLVKETLAALVNGILVAVGTGLAVFLWDGRPALMAVISLAMIVNMTAAGLAGAAIPLILRASGRDPAQSSSIFLTTVTDVVGFTAFLGFAVLFMSGLT